MSGVLVLCDHAKRPKGTRKADSVLELNIEPPRPNVRLELWNITHWLLNSLKPVNEDLLRIATYVYIADGCVRRGTPRDVFNEGWSRTFNFVIPVQEPDRWNAEPMKTALAEMLGFLTDDEFSFTFVHQKTVPVQLAFEPIREHLPAAPNADCVSLFSGGIDSFAGAIDLYQRGRRPILVSHWSRSVLVKIQKSLVEPLQQRFSTWAFPHLGAWINRRNTTSRAPESTQRSRAFLFLALGAIVAHEKGLSHLVVCENGITTFNLPRLDQIVGANATRSTHPQTLRSFQDLAGTAFEAPFTVETPFMWNTRAEILDIVKQTGCADLLPLTNSCAQSQTTRMTPFCGVCSQCIDRRFAMIRGGVEDEMHLLQYKKDIFIHALDDGQEVMQASSPILFALEASQLDKHQFWEKYGQVLDALNYIPGSIDDNYDGIYQLHRRFAQEVLDVFLQQQKEHFAEQFKGELPDRCLLMLRGVKSASAQRATELSACVRECPVGEARLFVGVCRDVFTYLFCDAVPPHLALQPPEVEVNNDQGYQRRDIVLRNTATEGFWRQVRDEYSAAGIVVDAKNYKTQLEGDTVGDFAKYLNGRGLGNFGLLVARKVTEETRDITLADRPNSAVHKQRQLWFGEGKMVVLLDDQDLQEMLGIKARGGDPTDLLADRIYTLKKRI